jgi:hypothetical protein
MGRACSIHGEDMNTYSVLVREPEGKRPLDRPIRMWEDNIKVVLTEIGWGAMD